MECLPMNLDTFLTDTLARIDKSGFSVAAICRRADIDPSLVSRWKAGTVEPRISSLVRINDAIDGLVDEQLARLREAGR